METGKRGIHKSKISTMLFVLGGLLSMCCHPSQAIMSEKIFARVTGPNRGAERLGAARVVSCWAECGLKCLTTYGSRCQTILYNSDTGLCTPGSFLKSGLLGMFYQPTSPEGDLFAPPVCDTSDDFIYVTSGNASACMLVVNTTVHYYEAYNYCLNLGSHLFVGRTLEKLDLLPYGEPFYIGMTDLASEGTFVWQDTAEPIDEDFKKLFFKDGEPNNNLGAEHCAVYTAGEGVPTGDDYVCYLPSFKFVCERPINN